MARKGSTKKRRFTEAELAAAERAARRAAQAPGIIPGIHNYCDRWCERCPQTARCSVFHVGQAEKKRRGGRTRSDDAANEAFWDELSLNFAAALRMLQREAKKRGIDIDAPDARAEAEIEERQQARRAAREGSALHKAATAYWKSAGALLDRLPEELRATEDELNTQARLGAGDPRSTAEDIRDALDVVQWYQHFIDVKLQRAVSSRVDEASWGGDGYPSDANGSAKVALVAIDRSLAAWAGLREHLDGEGDAILDLLVRLERLRRAVEREFPRARAYKRPGLD